MSKTAIIVLVAVIVIVIGGIIVFNFVSHKEKIAPAEQAVSEENLVEKQEATEVTGLSATVLSVDVENNFLTVKPENQDKEIKVIISDGTEIIKLGFPKDMPEHGGVFVPTEEKIDISGFNEGDQIYIRTTTNLAGKTELNDVEFIQVLPQ